MPVGRHKPEIKSPAGHWPQLRAAIEAGADAVYFGLTHFTARTKSGFTLEELPEALRTLIIRGSAIYERVRRLDETMYGGNADAANANGVSDQMAKLQAAFAR